MNDTLENEIVNLTTTSPVDVNPASATAPEEDLWPELSKREAPIAVCLAVGMTCREIADELKISVKTVDTHRGHILQKLDLENVVELCRMAIRRGAVEA